MSLGTASLSVTLCLVCLTACATVQGNLIAHPVDEQGRVSPSDRTASGLVVSCRNVRELESDNFVVIEVTFENVTDDWVRVHGPRIGFDSAMENESIFIPWGDDLTSWVDAALQTQRIRAINEQNTGALIAGLGAFAALAGGRSSVGKVGGLVAVGALGALAVRQAEAQAQSAATVRFFPENHLMAGAFSIPPKLFAKKWITLNAKPEVLLPLQTAVVGYEVEGRPLERVRLTLDDRVARRRPGYVGR